MPDPEEHTPRLRSGKQFAPKKTLFNSPPPNKDSENIFDILESIPESLDENDGVISNLFSITMPNDDESNEKSNNEVIEEQILKKVTEQVTVKIDELSNGIIAKMTELFKSHQTSTEVQTSAQITQALENLAASGEILNPIDAQIQNHADQIDANQAPPTDPASQNSSRNGQQLGEPVSFPIEYKQMTVVPRSLNSLDKGLFTFGMKKDSPFAWFFAYINATGLPTFEDTFWNSESTMMYSNSQNLYGLCAVMDDEDFYIVKDLFCVQYDWKINEFSPCILSLDDSSGDEKANGVTSIANYDIDTYILFSLNCDKNHPKECKSAGALKASSGEFRRVVKNNSNLRSFEMPRFLPYGSYNCSIW
ncbi:hypothetical protein QAD02_011821 [Eretmocerus hayati]|uniref:Uncharacterized protein n=1 Tax=Eretmocerus hayati TaxID=131215 RepID=A0ACC2P2N7_9HYME|nr:hypothetical protein QAD02_011821 [Eretmocerus hayati]